MSTPFGSRLLGTAEEPPVLLRRRLRALLGTLLVGTHLLGAGIVVAIAALLVPFPEANPRTVSVISVGVPTYVTAAVLGTAVLTILHARRALAWTSTPIPPTDAERLRTLRLPGWLTVVQFAAWGGAAVLFGALAAVVQPERALATALTLGTAAITVSGVAYLLADFALRPVVARALAGISLLDRPRGVGLRARALIFFVVGTAVPVVALVTGAVTALASPDLDPQRQAVITIVVGVAVLVGGLTVTVLQSGSVADPLVSVRDAMLDLERGDLDREVVVYDGSEVGLLQVGFNQMAAGLRERERLRDLFGRHVGRDVAVRAADADEVLLGGEARVVSVLFVDLAGSTAFAATRPPGEVVEVLNRFFGVVVDEVDARAGLVNKFIGDAVLAVFGAPSALPDHAARALAAARAVADRLRAELPDLRAGVGVATGEVVMGNVGHEERFEFTVVGDAVNSASRLTDLAKARPEGVLATWDAVVAAAAAEAGAWEPAGEATLRGRAEPTALAVPR